LAKWNIKQKICALNDKKANERQGKSKCTQDKEIWEPEKRVERKGDSIFQATRATKMRLRSRNECEFQGNPPQRNRSIDEEQGTDNTWLPLIGRGAQIFAPRAEKMSDKYL